MHQTQTMAGDTKCPVCGKKVKDNHQGIECEVCEKWYHIQCDNVTVETYKSLNERNRRIHYYCTRCELGAASLYKKVITLELSNKELEEKITKMEKKVEGVPTREEMDATIEAKVVKKLGEKLEEKAAELVSKEEVKELVEEKVVEKIGEKLDEKVADLVSKEEVKELVEEKIVEKIDEKLDEKVAELVSKEQVKDLVEEKVVEKIDEKLDEKVADLVSKEEVKELVAAKIEEQLDTKIEESIDSKVDGLATNQDKGEICTNILKEIKERESRANKLIIHGMKESESEVAQTRDEEDKEQVQRIMAEIDINETNIKIRRLGKKEQGKNRPVQLTVKDAETKSKIIGNAKKLKNSASYKEIGISHDLTKLQREEIKNLRGQAREKSIGGKIHIVIGGPSNWRIVEKRDTPQEAQEDT